MAYTAIQICKLALSHLGHGGITSLSEASEAARACNTFYELARETTLRDLAWPFARKTVDLSLVEENPTTEWGYAYRYPSDALEIRRLVSGTVNETSDTRIPYDLAADDSGTLIYTNQSNAQAEYTWNVTDAARFHPDFVLALSYQLAYLIAPRVTGGNVKIEGRVFQLYTFTMRKAAAKALREVRREVAPESAFIRARR